MAPNISCSLKIYAAKANRAPPNPAAAPGGIIEVRIRLRYQLCIKARGAEILVDDILTPEFVTPFAMPLAFLLPELSVTSVSNMLAGLNVEAEVRDFVSPKIAKFGVDAAKHYGPALSGFKTVAQVSITKIDFIREEEFDRISRTLELEDIGGSKGLMHDEKVKSEEKI